LVLSAVLDCGAVASEEDCAWAEGTSSARSATRKMIVEISARACCRNFMARPLYPQKLYYLRRDFVLREERFARSAGIVCFLFVWKVSRDAS
jgi:hypothetical protein